MTIQYAIAQELDLRGSLEEFTNDAYLTLPRSSTRHLNEDGLPVTASKVFPGLLLIGRFGTTASYNEENLPDDLERWSTEEDELIKQYGHMFYDASFYVPDGVYGEVKAAYLETLPNGRKRAVVQVEAFEGSSKQEFKP